MRSPHHSSTTASLFVALVLLLPAILCAPAYADVPTQIVGQYGGQVAGSAQSGHYMYIGRGPGVLVFDTTDPLNPIRIGQSDLLVRPVADVALSGNTLYALDNDRTIYILDISAPAHPALVGSCVLTAGASKLEVSGNYLYAAPSNPGALGYPTTLRVIDISSPRSPVLRGSYQCSNTIVDIAVKNARVYLAVNGRGLEIVDAVDPDHPALVGLIATERVPTAVYVSGNRMYTVSVRWIDIYDITSETAISLMATITTSYVGAMVVNGNYLYFAESNSYYKHAMDVTDPLHPVDTYYREFVPIVDSWVVSGSALFALGKDLYLLDISNPGSMAYKRCLDVGAVPSRVAVSGPYVFLPDGSNGLQIIDSSDPAHPVLAAKTAAGTSAMDVAVRGGYAYVATGVGLRVYDVSDPRNPAQVGELSVAPDQVQRFVTLAGKYAYLYGFDKVYAVDITNPIAPVVAGFFDAQGLLSFAAADGLVYYKTRYYGEDTHVVDMSDPANPVVKGPLNLTTAYGLGARGKYLFAVADDDFRILDMSDPTAPVTVGHCTIAGSYGTGVSLSGNYAFVPMDSLGTQVVDISNPAAPVPVATIPTSYVSEVVVGSGGYAYIAEEKRGLSIASVGGLWVEDICPRVAANTGVTGTMIISGSGFQAGATVKLTRPGATDVPAGGVVVTPKRITCTFDLTGAPLGLWDLVVTNPGAQSARITEILSVQESAPTITGINPATQPNTVLAAVDVTGTGFPTGAMIQLSKVGDADIQGTDTVQSGSTSLTCKFNLVRATPGQWDVVLVKDGVQLAVLAGAFTIYQPPAPAIASVTPNPIYDTGQFNLTLAGTGFFPGATVKLTMPGQSDIPATGVTVVSPTQINCSVNTDQKPLGKWNVIVTNPGSQTGTLNQGLEIINAIRAAKLLPNGGVIAINGVVVTAVFGDYYYVESLDRAVGLLVYQQTNGRAVGDIIGLSGSMQTQPSGERCLNAAPRYTFGTGSVDPVLLSVKALGGVNWNYNSTNGAGQKGVTNGLGLNNIGLLTSVIGKVTFAGTNFFWVDDGSGVRVGAYKGVKVQANGLTLPALDSYVKVTGISSMYVQGSLINRVMLTRSQADVVPITAP